MAAGTRSKEVLEEDISFVEQLQKIENKKGQALTTMEIQGIELEYNEYVMNYFMYHQQSKSIEEYENSFLQLKCWAETWSKEIFPEDFVVSVFIGGLKEKIRKYVEGCFPKSLQRSIDLAKQQELCHATKVFDKSSQSSSLTPDVSNQMGLEVAVEATTEFLNKAVKLVIVGDPKLCVEKTSDAFVELANTCGYAPAVMPSAKGLVANTCGYAPAVMPSAKGLVPEHHPHFIGIYCGAVSTSFCAEIVESADAYLIVGPIFKDYSSVWYSLLLKKEKANTHKFISRLQQEFQLLVVWVEKIMVFDPGGMYFGGCNHPNLFFF